MMTKKDITEVFGLSCVEKYFLAWLRRFYDIHTLYGSAFVSFAQVFDDFSHGATYQHYGFLPRLQDVAEEYGIVTHTYIACSAAEAMEILRGAPDDMLCLMRVNTAFFTDFKRASWREDHYICINGSLEWINEYPLAVGKFDETRFREVYDGALCLYALADMTAKVPDGITAAFSAQTYDMNRFPFGLERLESAIGILRVTRRRMEKFYKKKEKAAQAFGEENALLDKIYFDVRLRQLQEKKGEKTDKGKSYDALCEKLQAVFRAEKKAAEALKQ